MYVRSECGCAVECIGVRVVSFSSLPTPYDIRYMADGREAMVICALRCTVSPQCTFDTAIQDTLTFFSLYNTTVQNSNVNSSEGPSLFIVGGGCPERTEGVAKLTKFLFSLEV